MDYIEYALIALIIILINVLICVYFINQSVTVQLDWFDKFLRDKTANHDNAEDYLRWTLEHMKKK